jgi:hypothetical protein
MMTVFMMKEDAKVSNGIELPAKIFKASNGLWRRSASKSAADTQLDHDENLSQYGRPTE